MTAQQNKAAYALLNKLGLSAQKENILLGISNGRTGSMKELNDAEGIELIKYLKSQDPEEQKAEKQRRKIIAIARSMGWEKNFVEGGNIVRKADMQRIDQWCIDQGHKHKKLNQYLLKDLPTLVFQMEQVEKSFLKGI